MGADAGGGGGNHDARPGAGAARQGNRHPVWRWRRRVPGNAGDSPLAIRDIRIASDATFSEALRMDFGSTLQMDGRTIIMHAVRKLARSRDGIAGKEFLAR